MHPPCPDYLESDLRGVHCNRDGMIPKTSRMRFIKNEPLAKEWTCVFASFVSTVFQQKTLRPLSILGSVCVTVSDNKFVQVSPPGNGRPSSHQNITNTGSGRCRSWACYNLPMILSFLCASGVATMKNHWDISWYQTCCFSLLETHL